MTVAAGVALHARGVARAYGGVCAVDHVDLDAEPGRVSAVIGPNGAGKSTLFLGLAGVEPFDVGRVTLGDHDITELGADARARLGLTHTFQQLAIFPTLTVAENLRVGAENRGRGGLLRAVLGWPDPDQRRRRDTVELTLARLGLTAVADTRVADLPTGTLRLVELGRALCSRPVALLLDEPASGLDDGETQALQVLLRGLADEGLTVVLVEHDLALVFGVADVVHVMVGGRFIASGTPEEVQADQAVRRDYLAPQRLGSGGPGP